MTFRRIAAALLVVAALSLGIAPAAQAATSGNVACVLSTSASGASVRVIYSSNVVGDVYRGGCSKSGAQKFGVPMGWHCLSPWGYSYEGPEWWIGLNHYYYTISGNYVTVRLRCLRS